jgi:hypothetical protein
MPRVNAGRRRPTAKSSSSDEVARYLTVRDVPHEVAVALAQERTRLGTSMNATVIALLRRALGLTAGEGFDNGLARFANTWSKRDKEEFDRATAQFEAIDAELWR